MFGCGDGIEQFCRNWAECVWQSLDNARGLGRSSGPEFEQFMGGYIFGCRPWKMCLGLVGASGAQFLRLGKEVSDTSKAETGFDKYILGLLEAHGLGKCTWACSELRELQWGRF